MCVTFFRASPELLPTAEPDSSTSYVRAPLCVCETDLRFLRDAGAPPPTFLMSGRMSSIHSCISCSPSGQRIHVRLGATTSNANS